MPHPRPERKLGTRSHPAPASFLGARSPQREQRPALKRTPRPWRGHPAGARGGGADSLSLRRWGSELAPEGTPWTPAGTAARRECL